MDKFHCEPVTWFDLFDFLEYTDTESQIADYVKSINIKE